MSGFDAINLSFEKNYAIVQLDYGKVNAISIAMAKDLVTVFSDLKNDDKVKGVILSGRPHCFSAGLDIVELAQGGLDGSKEFWTYYLQALIDMVRFPKPLVCAITGYAPAGATIMALCGDYRIMGRGPKHVIGMHEFKMSMLIPELLCDIYAYHMGEKQAWEAVQNEKLFSSDEAVTVGLVNESVEVDEVMNRAIEMIEKLTKVYGPVFKKSKIYLRKNLLRLVDREVVPMVQSILENTSDPFVKQMTEMFAASLKK